MIGGLEDGSVAFWDATRLLGGVASRPALFKHAHSGPVRGLAVNRIDPYVVASGSFIADARIWSYLKWQVHTLHSIGRNNLCMRTRLTWATVTLLRVALATAIDRT